MIDTIKIGHMMGPPFWKLSIRKFVQPDFTGCAGDAAALAAGEAPALKVAETTGLGIAPGAPDEVAGAPVAGDGITPGAAGDATAPGAAGDVATPGGGGKAGVVAAAGGGGGGGV